MAMASNTEHVHVFLHCWHIWPSSTMFFNMLVVQSLFQVIMFNGGICIQTGTLSQFSSSFWALQIAPITYETLFILQWNDSDSGDLDSPPNSPSPGHSIVLDPAPISHFSESSITAALYSIIVTLIKVPSPDPFPEWNLPPLLQPWDNGPCYSREQGPTVSRLLAYSPGLIILTLWGTVLLGKALALGGPVANSNFLTGAKTGICTRTNGKTMAESDVSIQFQKVNIIWTRELVWPKCVHAPKSLCRVSSCQALSHSNKYEIYGDFNLLKVTDHSGGGPLRHQLWIALPLC